MKPIRVLHVIGSLNSGGSQALVMNIYRNIDRNKVQFDFIIDKEYETFYEEEIKALGGRVYILKNIKDSNLIKFWKQWNDFFQNHTEYKIIHGHVRSVASIYLKIAKKYGIVTIAHSHSTASRGNKIEQLIKYFMQLPIRYIADYLFACSNEAGKWLFGSKSIIKQNYKVINNAIDIDKYIINNGKRSEIRRLLGIENSFVLGHVGTFTYPKNHKFLIGVFYELQKKNRDAKLLIVGDGPLRIEIEQQIKYLGIEDKVIITGVVSNVYDYMQAMDVFVFPSIFEGLPVTLIEAQAAGLECIISDVISKEVIITKLVSCVSLGKSENEWVNIIESKINLDRKNTKELIRLNGFDIKEASQKLINLYCEMLNQKK